MAKVNKKTPLTEEEKAAAATKKSENMKSINARKAEEKKFDVNKHHTAQIKKNDALQRDAIKTEGKQGSSEYQIDIKGSYEASLPYADTPEKLAHLQEVLASGNHRHDR